MAVKHWADTHWMTILVFAGAILFNNVGLAVIGAIQWWHESSTAEPAHD